MEHEKNTLYLVIPEGIRDQLEAQGFDMAEGVNMHGGVVVHPRKIQSAIKPVVIGGIRWNTKFAKQKF